MLLTAVGLGITTIISLIGIVFADTREWLKIVLATLTVAGCVLATCSAWSDYRNSIAQQHKLDDLDVLERLSGDSRYYVRIATAPTRADLQKALNGIDTEFRGAKESGMVAIRAPRSPKDPYKLVFGQNLDFAAAEVFQQFAMSHRLTPIRDGAQELASILPEPASASQSLPTR